MQAHKASRTKIFLILIKVFFEGYIIFIEQIFPCHFF